MSSWSDSLLRPQNDESQSDFDSWFCFLAELLLNECQLVIHNQVHRLTEIEFYYYGPDHEDPFAHRDPIQLHPGRWYFHKTKGSYRGGSFKGVDLTFGPVDAYGGILFRGIQKPDEELIDGPSLLVDYLLNQTKIKTVSELDSQINQRLAWDETNLLTIQRVKDLERKTVYRCPRVGLSLKKAISQSTMPRFLMLPYRFLTEPKRIAKGKPQTILGLYQQGLNASQIRELVGSTAKSIQNCIEDFESGKEESSFEPYFGKDLSTKDLCQLAGIWHTLNGS